MLNQLVEFVVVGAVGGVGTGEGQGSVLVAGGVGLPSSSVEGLGEDLGIVGEGGVVGGIAAELVVDFVGLAAAVIFSGQEVGALALVGSFDAEEIMMGGLG